MCSHLCTHFHVSNCKNEEYIRRKERDARTHSFLRESVMGVTKNPHGHPIKSVHVKILGKVQGCYFRKWAREQAKYMTINGWIRNCKDGSVEAVFSGKSAAVDTMLEYCKTGPARARVDSMQVDVCDQPRGVGFKQLPDYTGEEGAGGGSASEVSGRPAMGQSSRTRSL